MSESPARTPRSPFLRRAWKPALATGAGGTATAVWFEEIVRYGEEILALVFLPLMAGTIYLLNTFMFNTRRPRPEDKENDQSKKGAAE